jgi:DNA-binding IclR family transcriptional regulator
VKDSGGRPADAAAGERSGIQSVEVGFALLEALGRASGPLMLRDLAASAGMSAAKAHRYLVSFQRLRLVTQDAATTRYDLGPAALTLGLAALSRLDPVKLARDRAPRLVEALGHTVALAVWGNHGPTIVHWEEAPQAIAVHLRLGDVMPLLTSATGRCFAAWMPAERVEPLLRAQRAARAVPEAAGLPRTLADARPMLQEVRARGLGRVVDTLLPGIAGFCAPVFDADGRLALGIVSLGPTGSFNSNWDGPVATTLRAAAHALSRDLGAPEPAFADGAG